MALAKIPVAGSVMKIKANGGTAEAIVANCTEGSFIADFGSYSVETINTMCGVSYEKSDTPTYASTTMNGKFTGDSTDAFQILMFQALKNTGDFAVDNTLNISIELPDTKGTNGTTFTYDVLVIGGKSEFDPTKKLSLNFDVQQVGGIDILSNA